MAGKTAIVTGASKGIGRAVAAALAKRGVRVVAIARSQSALDALARENAGIDVLAGDVCDADVAERAVSMAVSGGNTLNALVLNAATVGQACRIADLDARPMLDGTAEGTLRAAMAVNFASPLLWIQHALSALRASGGRVLLLGTIVGRDIGAPGMAAYAASKCAASAIVQCLAAEEALPGLDSAIPGITCALVVSPGLVATDASHAFMSGAHSLFPEDKASAAILSEIEHVRETGRTSGQDMPAVNLPSGVADAIACAAMNAPASLSGKFLGVDSREIASLTWE